MKLIWKLKRILVRKEHTLVCKRYRDGIINREEYIKHLNRINSKYEELFRQAEINGW